MLNLIIAVINGGCAVYLAWTANKTWKYLDKSLRVLNVCVVLLNVACCAMNLVRAFAR